MKKRMTVQQFASLGGKARWAKLDKKQRAEIASKAVKVRWDKVKAAKAVSE